MDISLSFNTLARMSSRSDALFGFMASSRFISHLLRCQVFGLKGIGTDILLEWEVIH